MKKNFAGARELHDYVVNSSATCHFMTSPRGGKCKTALKRRGGGIVFQVMHAEFRNKPTAKLRRKSGDLASPGSRALHPLAFRNNSTTPLAVGCARISAGENARALLPSYLSENRRLSPMRRLLCRAEEFAVLLLTRVYCPRFSSMTTGSRSDSRFGNIIRSEEGVALN